MFVNGVQCCLQTNYYPSAKPKAQLKFSDEGQVYFQTLWSDAGDKWEGPIVDDKKNGEWIAISADGVRNEQLSGIYRDDVKVQE